MNEDTLEKMRKLKFYGMFRAFKTSFESGAQESFTADEITSHLIQAEWDERQNRSIEQRIKNAKFRYRAAVEEINYNNDRNVEKNQVMRFSDCTFINKNEKRFDIITERILRIWEIPNITIEEKLDIRDFIELLTTWL